MYRLAVYYEEIEANIELAKKYYLMAAHEGDDDAIQHIKELLFVNFDPILAVKSYNLLTKKLKSIIYFY